uniref:JmjC domain-containing protein n=1 Tax=Panagrolaimus sp. ES5 TaxID=591445 RepID=A0AC34FTM1_9BILA
MLLTNSRRKVWLFFPIESQPRLNAYINFHRQQPCDSPLLHQKFFIEDEEAKKLNLKSYYTVQRPGEIIVIGPGVCYQTCAEEVTHSEEMYFWSKNVIIPSKDRLVCPCVSVLDPMLQDIHGEFGTFVESHENQKDEAPLPIKVRWKKRKYSERNLSAEESSVDFKREIPSVREFSSDDLAKESNMEENGNMNDEDPATRFFAKKIRTVTKRIHYASKYLKAHVNPAVKKKPRLSIKELKRRLDDDNIMTEELVRARIRYHILKQIYLRGENIQKANFLDVSSADEAIRTYFQQISNTDPDLWEDAVRNAIKTHHKKPQATICLKLIHNEHDWNDHFKGHHGIVIPWKEWSDGIEIQPFPNKNSN